MCLSRDDTFLLCGNKVSLIALTRDISEEHCTPQVSIHLRIARMLSRMGSLRIVTTFSFIDVHTSIYVDKIRKKTQRENAIFTPDRSNALPPQKKNAKRKRNNDLQTTAEYQ